MYKILAYVSKCRIGGKKHIFTIKDFLYQNAHFYLPRKHQKNGGVIHLIETYALSCGLKIDRPYVFEHYTSVPFEKFISFNKKCYPYYLEVINLIKPELDKRGIHIVQLQVSNNDIEAPDAISNSLTFGQWAYLIKRSLLHFGEDDYLFDLAGYYDIPRVILFSNTFPNTSKPYWGASEKQRIIFEKGPFEKPSFSSDINSNFVRLVKPEDIAQHIMDLLEIPWEKPYQTIFAGQQYRPAHDFAEIVPDKENPIQLNGRIASVCVRMDYNFDEQFLANVLEKTKASIVTNKPVNMNLLHMMRSKIAELAYIINDESDIQFARDLAKLNFPYALLSLEPTPQLKEKFFEVGLVSGVVTAKLENVTALKDGLKGLFYKSSKRVLHGSNEYKGQYEWANKLASQPNDFSPCPEEPSAGFMREIDFYYIVRPI